MKLDWQRPFIGIAAFASATFLAGVVGLSTTSAAPADQPVSNAPANEQPPNPAAAPADTGTKALPGPPSPFEDQSAAPAPADQGVTGRKSLAQPAPIQGPLGTPQGAVTPPQGNAARPNPFETQPSTESKTESKTDSGATAPTTPDKTATPEKPSTAPSAEKPATPSTKQPSSEEQPSNPSAEQPSEETYTPAQQAVRTGIGLLQKEKYEEAIGHFDEALKIDPNEGAAWFYKGVAFRLLNRLDEAIDAFTTSIELTTDDLDAQAENYIRRGIVWFYKGEYGIAWQDFDDAAIYAKAEDPRPDFWKALARVKQNRLLEAANSFAESIEHDDHYGPAYVNLGLTYLTLEEPMKAIYCFDQAVRLDSHNATNYFKRGVAQTRADKLREAADSYSQAIRIDPNYAEAYFNRSLVNRRLGETEQAEKDRAAAVKIKPDIEKQLTGTG